MRLIVGGRSQGKLSYCRESQEGPYRVFDGGTVSLTEFDTGAEHVILDRLHLFIRRVLDAKLDPTAELDAFLSVCPDADIICDEVGNGVVPIDEEERAYREAVGRATVYLAKKADTVERVVCGLPQKIK